MCLAIPAKIIDVSEDNIANVDILGARRSASLDLVPQAHVGDYVLVHAGFAIEVVDPQFAQETLDLIAEFPELADESCVLGAPGAGAQPGQGAAPVGAQGIFAALAAEDFGVDDEGATQVDGADSAQADAAGSADEAQADAADSVQVATADSNQ